MENIKNLTQQEFEEMFKEKIEVIKKEHLKKFYQLLHMVQKNNQNHAYQIDELKNNHIEEKTQLQKKILQKNEQIQKLNMLIQENEEELKQKSQKLQLVQKQLEQIQQHLKIYQSSSKSPISYQHQSSINGNSGVTFKSSDIEQIIKRSISNGVQKIQEKNGQLRQKDLLIETLKQQLRKKNSQFGQFQKKSQDKFRLKKDQIETLRQQLQKKKEQLEVVYFKLQQSQQKNQQNLKTITQLSQKSILKLNTLHQNQTLNYSKIHCSFSQKQAIQVCLNKQCNQKAFLCENTNCQCCKKHQKCQKITIDNLINKINSRKVSISSLMQCLTLRIQHIINLLYDFHDKTFIQMKENLKNFDLNPKEIMLMQKLKNGQNKEILGKQISQIIISEKQQKFKYKIINQTQKAIQRIFNYSTQSIQQRIKAIKMELQDFGRMKNIYYALMLQNYFNQSNQQHLINQKIDFYSSKIVSTLPQFRILQNLFNPKTLKSAKLLYRASQNNFEVKKFHQKCDGISNTLLVLQTEFGTKIGAFTPVKWASPKYAFYAYDVQMRSFIFSLDNGDKFELKSKDHAIYNDSNIGPTFGLQGDLSIRDKANKNSFSSVNNINDTYKNEKYLQYNDSQKMQRFIGNECLGFTVNQWQMWQVSFNQQLLHQ